jgi:hypothetical protein
MGTDAPSLILKTKMKRVSLAKIPKNQKPAGKPKAASFEILMHKVLLQTTLEPKSM